MAPNDMLALAVGSRCFHSLPNTYVSQRRYRSPRADSVYSGSQRTQPRFSTNTTYKTGTITMVTNAAKSMPVICT